MNTFVVIASLLSAASAGVVPAHPAGGISIAPAGVGPSVYVRAPAHDSASIQHHRLGGNFAYSTAERHAFARITPQLSTITHPVAETTHVHQPAPIATVQPAAIVKTTHVAKPVFGQEAILAQKPVIGPVRAHTEVRQPVVKTQTFVKSTPIVAVNQYERPVGVVAAHGVAAHGVAPIAAHGVAPIAAHGVAAVAAHGVPAVAAHGVAAHGVPALPAHY